jgi:hypothetical protein
MSIFDYLHAVGLGKAREIQAKAQVLAPRIAAASASFPAFCGCGIDFPVLRCNIYDMRSL